MQRKYGRLGYAALTLFTALTVSLPSSFQPVSAESAVDPAPEIKSTVVNANNGKKILFDNTHGQTAGTADWVIDGGFSDFGKGLANNGFDVKELRKSTPITASDLSSYSVFVIPEANIPYKASEQAAILQYVQNGGSVFFIADHYNADRNKNRWDSSEVFNGYRRGAWTNPAKGMSTEEANSAAMQSVTSSDWLSANFGVRFRYNAIGDVTANDIVAPSQAFGITQGVSTVAMHAGSTVAIMDPNKAKGIVYLPKTTTKWSSAVDQGVYNGGGRAEGPFAAVSKVGAGKAAFIGDSSPVEDATPKYKREDTGSAKTTYDGYKEQNDATLLVNVVNWLAKQEGYTALNQVSGLQLDQATTLLASETPGQSTEPQPEPWSAPAAGYKWYDATTFASGSYGYGGGTTQPPATSGYSFDHQAVLPTSGIFQIRVKVNGLTANTTYSTFNLGVYNGSGTQIAKVQNTDGSWPSAYGYSSNFSITTDASGNGQKVMNVQLNSSSTGNANLRLRQSSTNVYTEAVTVGNVAVEPLP
ncbi:GldG family protein [Fictibacillus sp. KIGAM418]|uniref:GldG family protein n=1 Tax=Fictibacillus marinisediminis TaxID=2878389 RepID=A0A9X1X9I7_9BACL|nr:GldG family protein [Fictibacillus marinisediminis]MCK6255665.1 GldG family protein [Fictibacillus marinisediminis]